VAAPPSGEGEDHEHPRRRCSSPTRSDEQPRARRPVQRLPTQRRLAQALRASKPPGAVPFRATSARWQSLAARDRSSHAEPWTRRGLGTTSAVGGPANQGHGNRKPRGAHMPNRTSIATHLSRMLQHFERARRDAGTRLEAANRHERAAWNKIENLLQAFREQLADRQAGSEIVACFL